MSETALVLRLREVIIQVVGGPSKQKMADERQHAPSGRYGAISGGLSAHSGLLPVHQGIWDADHLMLRPQDGSEVDITEVASLIRTLIVDDEPVARSVLRRSP